MQQIIYFISKNSTKLLFLLLLVVSLYLTVQTHSYHNSKMLHSANVVSGTIYEKTNSVTEYLQLKNEYISLAEENGKMEQMLYNSELRVDSRFAVSPETRSAQDFKLFKAKIIKNSYHKKNKCVTMKEGKVHGIKKDMGV